MQDGNRSWDERKWALQIKTDYDWQKWLRLTEMCALNNLVNCESLLKHLCIPKITWESHNGRNKNKNDHVKRVKYRVKDKEAKQGAKNNKRKTNKRT